MIRPDLNSFDSGMRHGGGGGGSGALQTPASPMKLAANSVLIQAIPTATSAARMSWSNSTSNPIMQPNGSLPNLSSSCPRTPTSLKKRKDSGSGPANPYSNTYRRELERKLLEGDYVIFQFKQANTNQPPQSHHSAQIVPMDSIMSNKENSASSNGSTVTLGSLMGVSSLLLSASSPREFMFSPGASPQPSPALTGHSGLYPPRSPLNMHAINFLTQSSAALPLMSLDGGELSPTNEDGMAHKRPLTTQTWMNQHSNNNPVVSIPPLPSPLHSSLTVPPAMSFGHRRGSGTDGSGDNSALASSCGSIDHSVDHSVLNSGTTSSNESQRGSFSNSNQAAMLHHDHQTHTCAPSPAISHQNSNNQAPTPFTLKSRRRNNSGPANIVSRSTLDRERQGKPPGAPVTAFNVFGTRTLPNMLSSQQLQQNTEEDTTFTMQSAQPITFHTPPFHPATNSLPSQSPSHHAFLHVTHHSLPLPHHPPQPALPAALPSPPVTASQFEWLQVIGRGSFGEVWKVCKKSSLIDASFMPDCYAIKKHLEPLSKMGERRSFLRRTELLKQLIDGYNARISTTAMASSPPQSAFNSPTLHAFNSSPHHSHSTLTPPPSTYHWPLHLLKHWTIWQESSLLYTMTEYCELGDLFQFFCQPQQHHQQFQQQHHQPVIIHNNNDRDDHDMGVENDVIPAEFSTSRLRSSSSTTLLPSLLCTNAPPETKSITELDALQILHQMSDILAVLHRQNILHNDIKPDNINVTHRTHQTEVEDDPLESSYPYVYKLGDLGSIVNMSEWIDGDSEGDGSYLAPEVLNPTFASPGGTVTRSRSVASVGLEPTDRTPTTSTVAPSNITPKIDIYALGVSLCTLITGEKFVSTVLQQDLAAAQSGLIIMHDVIHSPTPSLTHTGGTNSLRHSSLAITTSPDMMMTDCEQSTEFNTPVAHHHHHHLSGTQSLQLTPAAPHRTLGGSRSGLPLSISHESLASIRSSPTPNATTGLSSADMSATASGFMTPIASTTLNNDPTTERLDNQIFFDPSRVPISFPLQDLLRRMISVHPFVRPSSEEIHQFTSHHLKQYCTPSTN